MLQPASRGVDLAAAGVFLPDSRRAQTPSPTLSRNAQPELERR